MGYKLTTRSSPTDLDTPEAPVEFDYSQPWPSAHYGQKFGPPLIKNALAKGLYVLASIDGIPQEWPVTDARKVDGVLRVLTLQGWRVPSRIWTVESLKGLKF